jgi:hypothetical protein
MIRSKDIFTLFANIITIPKKLCAHIDGQVNNTHTIVMNPGCD